MMTAISLRMLTNSAPCLWLAGQAATVLAVVSTEDGNQLPAQAVAEGLQVKLVPQHESLDGNRKPLPINAGYAGQIDGGYAFQTGVLTLAGTYS